MQHCRWHLSNQDEHNRADLTSEMHRLNLKALALVEPVMDDPRARNEDKMMAVRLLWARTMPTGAGASLSLQVNLGGKTEDAQVAASQIIFQRLRDRKAADEARKSLLGGEVEPPTYSPAASDDTIVDAEIIEPEPEPVAAQPIPEQPPAPDTETVAPEPVSEPDPLPPAAVTEPPSMGPQTARVLPEGSWWVIPPSLGVPGQHARHVDERAALLAMPHPHTIPRHAY